MSPLISVITPTYQRATTLPRLYESLLRQTFADFEWVVVDDGSDDGTESLVEGWMREASFSIVYHRQSNQGKHLAVNRGVELAKGEFCAVSDSDDWYAPEALKRMVACWNDIPAGRRREFASIEGLCADPNGQLVGDRCPADVFDSNTFEMEALHGVRGDTVGMYRRDVLLAHPFPADLGWHVAPALVWNRIAARWSSRFVNEIWGYKEYLPQGLTDRVTELRLRFPDAYLAYWTEFAAMPRQMGRISRLRANANCVRYSLLTGAGVGHWIGESPSRSWAVAAAPIGVLLYLRDRRLMRGMSAAKEG